MVCVGAGCGGLVMWVEYDVFHLLLTLYVGMDADMSARQHEHS